jgi:hypothetical protein
MAKKPYMPPALLGKPKKKPEDSSEEEDDDMEEDECGCGGHKGTMIKLSILLPDTLQPKRGK